MDVFCLLQVGRRRGRWRRIPGRRGGHWTITVYTFLQVRRQLGDVERPGAGHLHHVEQGVHVHHHQGEGAGQGLRKNKENLFAFTGNLKKQKKNQAAFSTLADKSFSNNCIFKSPVSSWMCLPGSWTSASPVGCRRPSGTGARCTWAGETRRPMSNNVPIGNNY